MRARITGLMALTLLTPAALAASPVSFGMSKSVNYRQDADGVVTPFNDYSAIFSVGAPTTDAFSDPVSIADAGAGANASVFPIAGIMVGNSVLPPSQLWYCYSPIYPDQASLDTDIPAGNYEFSFGAGVLAGGSKTITVLPSAFCPEIPELTGDTFSRLQNIKSDLASPFAGTVGGFTDATGANNSSLFIIVQSLGGGGPGVYYAESFSPSATAFTIPANAIEEGRAYFLVMYYSTSFLDPVGGIDGGTESQSFTRALFAYFNTRGSCPADLNADKQVDNDDFLLFVQDYLLLLCSEVGMTPKCPADLSNDGVVENADFVLFAQAYNDFLCP